MRIWIQHIKMRVRKRISILIFILRGCGYGSCVLINADPDPTFHFDAHADPDPTFHFDADSDEYPGFLRASGSGRCDALLT
jgi:hypothetical protein